MAALSFTFGVTNADGTSQTLTSNTYDLYRAEQQLGALGALSGRLKFTELLAIAWSAARRAGIAGDDFEAWVSEVEIDPAPELDEDEGPKD